MRVIITAGGTGGHIYPAIAIINKIKEMDSTSEFIYIGTHNRMEKDIIPSLGIKYIPIEIYGLSTSIKMMPRNVKNVFLIKKAINKCVKIIKEFKPDIVIGVGGYVTYPVITAANKCHVKTFIHEQNSIPGKSNRALAKKVDKVGVSFKESAKYFDSNKVVFTGNPVSENAIKCPKIDKTSYGLSKNKKSVLIFNGSLGSSVINQKMIDYLKNVSSKDYEILYVTGKNLYSEFSKNEFPKNVHVVPYVDNLSGLMKDIDLIISRAGASSVAEIEALRIPSILIPSPYVANNHQYYNALSIVSLNAGKMIEEHNLNPTILNEYIDTLLYDKEKVKEIKENLSKISLDNSSTIIYDEIKKMI